jgi:4-hydroxybenzoate polyprenyltransferase
MVKIRQLLKLVRVQNLFIVALTMVLMRYAIIEPILSILPFSAAGSTGAEQMVLQFAWYDFIILVLSTVFITAAGYVINDYFDIKTDLVNRGKVIVGTVVSRRKAMMWHNILNVLGITGGFYVSYKIGYFWLGIFFLLISGLLYFYSATYKRQLLVGNIIVSILTAAVPFMVVVFDIAPVYTYYSQIASDMPSLAILFYWVGGFSVFAFLVSLAREMVKDMEDYEGDRAYGSNSLPVAMGMKGAKTVTVSIVAIIILLLLFVWYFHLNDLITILYIGSVLILPLLIAVYFTVKGKDQRDFHIASLWIKIVMLSGILYSLIVYLIISKEVMF